MNMYYVKKMKEIIVLVLVIAVISCGKKTEETSFSLKGSTSLNENQYVLGQVVFAVSAGQDSIIITDKNNGIYLLYKNAIVRKIGQVGQAPLEYREVSRCDFNDGIFTVFDRTQNKLLNLNINHPELSNELISEKLTGYSNFAKYGDRYFFLKASLSKSFPDTTTILMMLTGKTFTDLNFKMKDINFLNVPLAGVLTVTANKQYFVFSYMGSNEVIVFDYYKNTFTKFIADDFQMPIESELVGKTLQEMIPVINKMDRLSGFKMINDNLLAFTKSRFNKSNDLECTIYYYSIPDLKLINKVNAGLQQPYILWEKSFQTISLNSSGNDQEAPYHINSYQFK